MAKERVPNVSVDCVVFGFDEEQLKVLLIEQRPMPGVAQIQYAIPGDLVFKRENLDEAAARILLELTSLKGMFLKQFKAFGDVDRVNKQKDKAWLRSFREKPDARVFTVGYFSLVKIDEYDPRAASFAGRAEWRSIKEIPSLAFDHNLILTEALKHLKSDLELKDLAFELLPDKFTLSQLQRVHEVVLEKELDKRNFRKKLKAIKGIHALEEKQKGVDHKPAMLYRFQKE